MALEKITEARGRAVLVAGNDIDTDRIIPARYLRCVTFDGLGATLFFDERFAEDGSLKGHALDRPERAGAKILVSGHNFGCGSSREHAPQAILRAGFKGIVAGSFAEIFYGNSTAIGLVCARLSETDLAALSAMVEADPGLEVVIDVALSQVQAGARQFPAGFGASEREALLTGYWDPIGELIDGIGEVLGSASALGHEAATAP